MLRKGLFILLVLVGLLLGGLAWSYEYTVSSERRWGRDCHWEEKGSSSVTDSPIFSKGVRVACWADGREEDYEYAIAHAEYHFPAPSGARSMRIYISYEGDDGSGSEGIAGRLWLRRRGFSEAEGDTFALRAGQRSETIRLSVDQYLIADPQIELRVVAEGSQRIDVEYIKVDFCSSAYEFRVVTRYYSDYVWRPWWHYTYWYHYPGRYLYWDSWLECWVEYRYPRYSCWPVIRSRYNAYIHGYYDGRRDERWRWQARTGGPRDIAAWSPRYADAHRAYRASAGDVRGSSRAPREKVRSVLAEHKRRRSAAVGTSVWADMDRTRSDSAPARTETRRGDASTLKQRREVIGRSSESAEPADRLRRQAPRSEGTKVRSGSAADLKHFRETSDARTGTSRETSRSSVKTRSGSSVRRSGTSLRSSEGAAAAREVRQEPRATRDDGRLKTRREAVTREVRSTPTRSSSSEPSVKVRRESVRRDPQPVRQAPSRQQVKDDDEEQKRRAAASRSTNSGSGSSRKRRR